MKKILSHLILLFCFTLAFSQSNLINSKYLNETWDSWWVTHPTEDIFNYGVFHFRKNFELDSKPENFIVHVSADNRYKLFVNGQYVCHGPARGDYLNWFYETIDIAQYLNKGKNTIAALVWNIGEYKPLAQISDKTAFILQGNSEKEHIANTDKGWKVVKNKAYAPIIYKDNDIKLNWQYYVAGALDSLNLKYYPHGWQNINFDDSDWLDVRLLDHAKPTNFSYHQKWLMSPRQVPLLNEEFKRFHTIARTEKLSLNENEINAFINGHGQIKIPANSKVSLLFDNKILTNGYPTLVTSEGKESHVQITYAEALFNKDYVKEHRDSVSNMVCFGVHDVFVPDGGEKREFTPLWTRPFRWIQLDITTKEEALILEDFHHHFVAYPTQIKAEFSCDNEMLNKIWDASINTQILSAQETFVSDLAWEQIQYIGDTKVQGLCYLYMTGDETLFKLALKQFNDSRESNGLTHSRYPCNLIQFTPLYSLVWISMVHDYFMMGQDLDYLEQFLPGIYEVLFWFEKQMNEEKMIPTLPYLDFVDSRFFERRTAIRNEKENQGSTVHSLAFCYALDEASDLFGYFGQKSRAEYYKNLRNEIISSVNTLCYSEEKGYMADSPSKNYISQHSNIMAVLTDAVPQEKQANIISEMLKDTSVMETQMYFHYYLGRAMNKAGLGNEYLKTITAWTELIDFGVKSFGEFKSKSPRSECHAWSTSPAYEFLATVCGIKPTSPGFKTIEIAPNFNELTEIKCKIPYQKTGTIELSLSKNKKGKVIGEIILPKSLTGTFIFNENKLKLEPGINTINLK